MRLSNCRGCGAPIRVTAMVCPFCGAAVRRTHAPLLAATALGIGLAATAGDARAGTTSGGIEGTSTSSTSGAGTTSATGATSTGAGEEASSTSPEGTGSGSDTDPAPIPSEPHYGVVSCDVGGDDAPASLAALGLLAFARRRN